MRIRRSVCSRASATVAGGFLTVCLATPAAAQEPVAPGLRVAVANAAVIAAAAPSGDDAQAPAEPAKPGDQAPATPPPPTPAEVAAKQDAATMSFFRQVELSGFVDTYYDYNFNTPKTACNTAG